MPDIKSYSINEQQTFSEEIKKELWEMNLDFSDEQRYLGLDPHTYAVKYYIGIDWLKENESYIVVHPKISDLDYVGMFVHCLHHPEISKHLKDAYHFDLKKPTIKPETTDWELTPFMIVHFLALVDKITKHGLKKNYIVIEGNLNGKIKGKIVFSQQLKKNIAAKREDRVYCRFQEYSVNCLENRLLKKALLFIQRYSSRHLKHYKELIQKESRLLACFEQVSDDISFSEIKRIKVNALYKEYVEAIELAKMILKHFGYSFKQAGEKEKELPPFWIDMSKLFELYVYSKLKEIGLKNVKYHYTEFYREIDFLINDEKVKMVADTKYKLYDQKHPVIEDIRQICAYARMEGLSKKLGKTENENIDCLIIYPCSEIEALRKNQDNESIDDLSISDNDDNKETFNPFFDAFKISGNLDDYKVKHYTKFYKCGIKLPTKPTN